MRKTVALLEPGQTYKVRIWTSGVAIIHKNGRRKYIDFSDWGRRGNITFRAKKGRRKLIEHNKLSSEIKEIIEGQLIEQDNQGRDDIGMMSEGGLDRAVEDIMRLLACRGIYKEEDWRKIGRNSEGENIYENRVGMRAIEKEHIYLIKEK